MAEIKDTNSAVIPMEKDDFTLKFVLTGSEVTKFQSIITNVAGFSRGTAAHHEHHTKRQIGSLKVLPGEIITIVHDYTCGDSSQIVRHYQKLGFSDETIVLLLFVHFQKCSEKDKDDLLQVFYWASMAQMKITLPTDFNFELYSRESIADGRRVLRPLGFVDEHFIEIKSEEEASFSRDAITCISVEVRDYTGWIAKLPDLVMPFLRFLYSFGGKDYVFLWIPWLIVTRSIEALTFACDELRIPIWAHPYWFEPDGNDDKSWFSWARCHQSIDILSEESLGEDMKMAEFVIQRFAPWSSPNGDTCRLGKLLGQVRFGLDKAKEILTARKSEDEQKRKYVEWQMNRDHYDEEWNEFQEWKRNVRPRHEAPAASSSSSSSASNREPRGLDFLISS